MPRDAKHEETVRANCISTSQLTDTRAMASWTVDDCGWWRRDLA